MKKILYTLFAVSLLAVACTQEVGVSRDHDIDAEVTDMQTKMELTTLYLNLTDNSSLDFDKLAGYVSAKEADVVMFVAPEAGFATWLNQFAADYKVLSVTNDDRRLVMAALVKSGVTINEVYTLQQGATLNNAVLHFKANNIHFVVTQLNATRNGNLLALLGVTRNRFRHSAPSGTIKEIRLAFTVLSRIVSVDSDCEMANGNARCRFSQFGVTR